MTDVMVLPEGADEGDVAAMREVILDAFCYLLHSRKLEPMTVLSLAAMAVGSVYKEVAGAHLGPDRCRCGWDPSLLADISGLQAALAEAAKPDGVEVLLSMAVAGHG